MSFFEQCVNQQRNLDRNVFKVNISNFLSNHVICFKTLLQTKQEFLLQDLSIRFTRNKKRFYVQIPDFARQFARIVIFFGTIPVLCANQIISARQNLIQLVPIFPSEHASLYFPGLTQVEIKMSQHFSLFFQARQRRSSLFQDSHDYCSETILLLSINCLALSSLPTTLTIACTHRKKAQDHCPETVLLLSINCPASSFFFRLDEGAHHCFNSQDYRSETVLLLPINCPALSFSLGQVRALTAASQEQLLSSCRFPLFIYRFLTSFVVFLFLFVVFLFSFAVFLFSFVVFFVSQVAFLGRLLLFHCYPTNFDSVISHSSFSLLTECSYLTVVPVMSH